MKSVHFVSVTIMYAVVFLLACNPGAGPQKVKTKSIGGIYISEQRGEPDGTIDDSLAMLMCELYAKDLGKSRERGINTFPVRKDGGEDTRSIWFSLETLENFIRNIKDSADTKNCPLATGVRIYYGIYPDNIDTTKYPALKGLESFAAGRHTIFFVPTYYSDKKGANVDFNFYNMGNDPCYPTPYTELIKGRVRMKSAVLGVDKSRFVANVPETRRFAKAAETALQNHGGMAPPPAAEASFPSPAIEQEQ